MNTRDTGSSGTTSGNTESTIPSGISRRTVVQGAAWSIPVIAAAVAIPAAAASTVQPDLDITYFETGPQDGQTQWAPDNGEPGYFQNKPLVYHLEVTSHAPGGSVSTFTLDVQLHASSYKNDTLQIVAPNDGWSIASVSPTANTTVTFTLVWVGTLAAGQTVPLWLHFATAGNPPAAENHVVPLSAITSIDNGADRDSSNNSQQGTPSYWVKHT